MSDETVCKCAGGGTGYVTNPALCKACGRPRVASATPAERRAAREVAHGILRVMGQPCGETKAGTDHGGGWKSVIDIPHCLDCDHVTAFVDRACSERDAEVDRLRRELEETREAWRLENEAFRAEKLRADNFDHASNVLRMEKHEALDRAEAAEGRLAEARKAWDSVHRQLKEADIDMEGDFWLDVAYLDESALAAASSPAPAGTAQPRLPPFEQAWAKKAALGYQYGEDALENVEFGYEIAAEELARQSAGTAPRGALRDDTRMLEEVRDGIMRYHTNKAPLLDCSLAILDAIDRHLSQGTPGEGPWCYHCKAKWPCGCPSGDRILRTLEEKYPAAPAVEAGPSEEPDASPGCGEGAPDADERGHRPYCREYRPLAEHPGTQSGGGAEQIQDSLPGPPAGERKIGTADGSSTPPRNPTGGTSESRAAQPGVREERCETWCGKEMACRQSQKCVLAGGVCWCSRACADARRPINPSAPPSAPMAGTGETPRDWAADAYRLVERWLRAPPKLPGENDIDTDSANFIADYRAAHPQAGAPKERP